MGLKEEIYQALKEKNPEALIDIKNFHHMTVMESLRVTDPEAYCSQHELLEKIQNNYKKALLGVVKDNTDLIAELLLDELTRYPTMMSNGYLTADMIRSN